MRQPLERPLSMALVLFAMVGVGGCKRRSAGEDSAVLDSTTGAVNYTGHSDYRLIFSQKDSATFNPNQDVAPATNGDLSVKLYDAMLYDAMRGAAMKSLVPILGTVTGNRTGTEAELLAAVGGMVQHAAVSLRDAVRPILNDSSANLPAVAEAFLIPWLEEKEDLFYDYEKISMESAEVANILKAVPGTDAFAKRLTTDVRALQQKLYASTQDPWFLLAARQLLFVAPGDSRLTVRVLIGLKPTEMPFSKTDDRVKFQKMRVPDLAQRGIVASLTFDVDLESPVATPKLLVEFGDFAAYQNGNFTVDSTTQSRFAPRLEGQANKFGTSWVALNFSFQRVLIDMRSAQVDSVNTLISPGIRFADSNWVVGGLRVESVDQTFQTEINNTIDTQLKSALDQANQKIFDGMMSKDIMDSAFKLIFGRGQAS